MTQLFHIARKQNPIRDLSAAGTVEEYDFSILWPSAPVSFHNPLPDGEVREEVATEVKAMVFPGHRKGELLSVRACYNCRKQDRHKLGTLRTDENRKAVSRYKVYTRTKFGCRTCGVPLCKNKASNCWVQYHTSDYCGQHDNIDPINWLDL